MSLSPLCTHTDRFVSICLGLGSKYSTPRCQSLDPQGLLYRRQLSGQLVPRVLWQQCTWKHRCFGNDYRKVLSYSLECYCWLLFPFQIMCCLDEYKYVGYHDNVPFTRRAYSRVYDAMLLLIDDVKGHPYHRKKFQDRCARWAREGM